MCVRGGKFVGAIDLDRPPHQTFMSRAIGVDRPYRDCDTVTPTS